MEKCHVCGKRSASISSYADAPNGVFGSKNPGGTITICDYCLLQHVSFHYPDCPIQRSIMQYHYIVPEQAAMYYPPASIKSRLSEVFFMQ